MLLNLLCMNVILASTSTVFGKGYLEYMKEEISGLFSNVSTVTFIPYARPSGISHDAYTLIAKSFFSSIGKELLGLHTAPDAAEAVKNAEAVFTGGGNTFLLVKSLHDLGLMQVLAKTIEGGTPYLGTSAGTNIAGINMQTTNDMPIVYPPSFTSMGIVPFNINPHYLDPFAGSTHMGETRETRIKEFHTQNAIPVVGLREGSWIRLIENKILLEGPHTARIFLQNKEPFELAPGSEMIF